MGLLANSWIIDSSIWVFRKPIFIFVPRVELHNKQRSTLSWEKTLRTEGALQSSPSGSSPMSLPPSCSTFAVWSLFVGYFMEYVTWFFEFAYWLLPDFANAPGPCGDRGEMAMAIARLFCPLLLSTSDTAFFPLYSFAVLGAAGHNRWGVAETPLPVKTQGRNLDRGLTFKPTPCVGCLLSPRGRPKV